MKPSYINGLILGAFVLFAIVYWNLTSTPVPQQSAASSSTSLNASAPGSMPSDHPGGVPAGLTIESLKERVEASPNDSTLLNHLAQILHDASRYEEAAVYYNKYLELAPKNIQGWLDLANVYAAVQEWEKALDASQSLLDFVPDHPSAMYNMGAIHANLANIDEATRWWTQVRDQQTDPDLAAQAAQNLKQIQPSASL